MFFIGKINDFVFLLLLAFILAIQNLFFLHLYLYINYIYF